MELSNVKEMSYMKVRGYHPDQSLLFGIDPEDRIGENDLVRFVSKLIDELDTSKLKATYSEIGSPSYDPVMMLKIVVYAYISGIYTCRKIAKAVRENINFIWLANYNTPDFRTINHFSWTRCRDIISDIFMQVVLRASEANYLEPNNCFIDATTMQANAGKYSYVWKANSDRYQKQVKARIDELFNEIEKQNTKENDCYTDKDLRERGLEANFDVSKSNSEEIKEELTKQEKKLNFALNKLNSKPTVDKDTQKALLREIRKIGRTMRNEIPKLQNYEKQLETMGDRRRSYSKTDNDATFMRMKDDRLLPGYKLAISTSEQFVTAIHLYNTSNESTEYSTLMSEYYGIFGEYPSMVIGDAAYGTALNFHYSSQVGIMTVLKSRDYKIDYRESTFPDLIYDENRDVYICEEGKEFLHTKTEVETRFGPERTLRKYVCLDCQYCPKARKCIIRRDKNRRFITFDPHITPLRKQNYENLKSEEGRYLSRRRCIEPESVFGNIKWNKKFTRFTVRSISKCKAQITLLVIGHNIVKMFNKSQSLATST